MRRDEKCMQRYGALPESGQPLMALSDVVSATDMANYGEIAVRTISSHTKESEANASGLSNRCKTAESNARRRPTLSAVWPSIGAAPSIASRSALGIPISNHRQFVGS
jgi:hypothetical protein